MLGGRQHERGRGSCAPRRRRRSRPCRRAPSRSCSGRRRSSMPARASAERSRPIWSWGTVVSRYRSRSTMPGHLLERVHGLLERGAHRRRASLPKIFSTTLPRTPLMASSTLSLIGSQKLNSTPGISVSERASLRPAGPWSAAVATRSIGLRWTNVSLMFVPSSSVPSSGWPTLAQHGHRFREPQDADLRTSSRISGSRARARCSAASRRRSSKSPSSSSGRNSLAEPREPTNAPSTSRPRPPASTAAFRRRSPSTSPAYRWRARLDEPWLGATDRPGPEQRSPTAPGRWSGEHERRDQGQAVGQASGRKMRPSTRWNVNTGISPAMMIAMA